MSSLANLIPIFGAAAAAVNEERSLTSRYVEYLAIAGGGLTGWGVGKGNGDRSCWTDPYRFHMGFWETDVVRWPAGSTNWRKKFRLSFATLRNLCTRLEPLMGKENTNFRPSIDVRKRIANWNVPLLSRARKPATYYRRRHVQMRDIDPTLQPYRFSWTYVLRGDCARMDSPAKGK